MMDLAGDILLFVLAATGALFWIAVAICLSLGGGPHEDPFEKWKRSLGPHG